VIRDDRWRQFSDGVFGSVERVEIDATATPIIDWSIANAMPPSREPLIDLGDLFESIDVDADGDAHLFSRL